MVKNNLLRKLRLVLIAVTMINMFSIQAFAWGGGRDRDPRDRAGWGGDRGREMSNREMPAPLPYEVVSMGRYRYRYHNGRFFRIGWFGLEFVLAAPPIGAVVTTIPVGRKTVFVNGVTYYYYDNIYYTMSPGGYIVVAEPVISPAPIVFHNPSAATAVPVTLQPQDPAAIVTINVPNSNGSYTPVNLTRKDNGYTGPQGEYYSGNPTVEQLKALYGK